MTTGSADTAQDTTPPEEAVLGQDLAAALSREWLVSDGLGGYASGSVPGPNTRRYHGVLVAPFAPPLGRHVLVSKLDETLVLGDTSYPLSANEYQGGTIYPQGYRALASFTLETGVPVWRYAAGSTHLEKRVWMERGHTTTHLAYTLEGDALSGEQTATRQPARLYLDVLCEFRDFHHQTVGSDDWQFQVQPFQQGVTVRAYAEATPFHVLVAPPPGRSWRLVGQPGWWWHFRHRVDEYRGQDYLGDYYCVGTLECELAPGETLRVAATVEDPQAVLGQRGGMPSLPSWERELGGEGLRPNSETDAFIAQLRYAADQFLVARPIPGEALPVGANGVPEARTVLAGYHWFGDWGRDTFIALPGLAQATGRWTEAREMVRTFSRYVDKGMLPNRFPDTGAPLNDGDYNTLDATLWYIHAVDVIDRATGGGLAEELFPVLEEIVRWHVEGTRFGIRMDPADGLIRADNGQLTWMDAMVGGWVVTPRDGKPVEIGALWHHALGLMAGWAGRMDRRAGSRRARPYEELRQMAANGFRTRYWYAEGGWLYDTVDGAAGDDASLRPNQIIAAALPDCPLTEDQRKSVVDTVVKHLWTPRGLRTLSPQDRQYRGHYGGDVWSRDGAYHQGTVWPWPVGPLVDAHLLVYGDRQAARQLVEPFRAHLFAESCAGSINEIFDGDAPHAPRGCVAQAWSVSEVFRAWMATEPPATITTAERAPQGQAAPKRATRTRRNAAPGE